MTVAELIAELSKMPLDAEVYYDGGEYRDNWRSVYKINQQQHGTLGKSRGVYIE